jgi:hypothetical protein
MHNKVYATNIETPSLVFKDRFLQMTRVVINDGKMTKYSLHT